jgi:hypothetical protein
VPGAKAFHFNASPEPDNARRKPIIEDHLRKVGCSFGACVSGGLQWTDDLDADAHRDNGKHFVVRADQKLTAFMGT